MKLTDVLTQVESFLYGDETPCEYGCSLDNIDEMVKEAKQLYPDKPYCTIRHWIWVDVTVPEKHLKPFTAKGIQPSLVRSGDILHDEAQRPHTRHSLRSSWLLDFSRNCLFVTRNTTYILVGPGSRVSVEPAVFQLLDT